MKLFWDMLFTLLVAALIQNLVLTTGFGTSIMLRIVRRPRDIWIFSGLLAVFSVLTVLLFYPVDALIASRFGTGWWVKIYRPVIVILIAAMLYLLAALLVKRFLPRLFGRIQRLLPLAAFNNVVVGVALVVNHQVRVELLPAVGLALGSCLGFLLLSWLTAEGMERLDNPDMPAAFRGLPATLVYLGLLALALMGFTPAFSRLLNHARPSCPAV